MSIKRWIVAAADKSSARALSEECGIDIFSALLLCSRGITDAVDAEEFISNDVVLCDPYEFRDMELAVKRIHTAIENGEKIAVFGDYDADGITSTALLVKCLKGLSADVIYRVPTRDEGYGICVDAIDELIKKEISLIITVDNGITAHEAISYANEKKIDVIVTDHHLPSDTLPNAYAVVDPHRSDCMSEFKSYAGVGVCFMLCSCLTGICPEELLYEYGDLVTIGTVADVMPLLHDNRMIVKSGVRLVEKTDNLGLQALIAAAGIRDKKITATDVAFMIAPRINASGRMGDPALAVELLLCEDEQRAQEIAAELNSYNVRRQECEQEILKQAVEFIESRPDVAFAPVICVWGKEWHHGVIGIIASRLSNIYSKPCVVFSLDGDEAVGSARSYDAVSIHSILSNTKGLTRFGGHTTAAGLACKAQDIESVARNICDSCIELYPLLPFNEVHISCKLNPSALSIANVYSQRTLEPFGSGNETPLYGLYSMKIIDIVPVGGGKHLRVVLGRDSATVVAMRFGCTAEQFGYCVGDTVDVAVTLDINNYRGEENLSCVIREMRCSAFEERLFADIRMYENYRFFNALPDVAPPTREEVGLVYRKIWQMGKLVADYDGILARFKAKNFVKLQLILDILCELSLVSIEFDGKFHITCNKNAVKNDLENSALFRALNKQ